MKKKKMEFSKVLLIIALILVLTVMIFSMVLMWRTSDTSPLAYLIPSVFALISTGYGFYYKKSEKENLIKIKQSYGDDSAELVKDTESYR